MICKYLTDEIKDIENYGSKAQGLFLAQKQSINIPQTIVVKCPNCWVSELNKEKALHIISEYVSTTLNKDCEYIVRSSNINEDTVQKSNAGKYSSIHIKSLTEIEYAVERVWDSSGSHWRNMGIVIQPYIDAKISGILFSNHNGEQIVELAYGSCANLVGGDISPYVYGFSYGWKSKKMDEVTDELLQNINRLSNKMQLALHTEVDIEFCIDKNNCLYLLQCRPITVANTRYTFMDKSISGEWCLHNELSKPFTPLILDIDPSGLLTNREHIVVNNYVYFNIYNTISNENNTDWYNWDDIEENFGGFFSQACDFEANLDNLNLVVREYRKLVNIYMNPSWFRYRKTTFNKLQYKLQEKFPYNFKGVLFSNISSINSINYKKRVDFINLLNSGCNDTDKKKFLKKYGFQTSSPFYILCDTLNDTFEDIILLSKSISTSIYDKATVPESIPYEIDDSELKDLINMYRDIIRRTENDDYILCMGAHVIRKMLIKMGEKIGLNKDSIYFLTYDELVKSCEKGTSFVSKAKIDTRKKAYECSKQSIMPARIVNGCSVYSENDVIENKLEGGTISPGKTSGQIYCLKDPDNLFEILCIPPNRIIYSTHIPAMLSSFFFNIKGLILSETSILSHGAIMARELGIPAIGGIKYSFVDNETVEIDGDKGIIKLL